MEADGATVTVGHEDFRVAVGEVHADEVVALADDDSLLALGQHASVLGQEGFLNQALTGGEYEVVRRYEILVAQEFAGDASLN